MAFLAMACVAFFPAATDDGRMVDEYSVNDIFKLELFAPESVEEVDEVRFYVYFDRNSVQYNDNGQWYIEYSYDWLCEADYDDQHCIDGYALTSGDFSEGQEIARMSFKFVEVGAGEMVIKLDIHSIKNDRVYSYQDVVEYLIVDGSGEEPKESSKVLVTIGQDGQSVCVVMYALDGKAIPSGTFKLKANYTYINEFGDLVSENQPITLSYKSDGSSCAMVADSSFVDKLDPEEYGHVFCITGTYQLGSLSSSVCKTAYSPVKV